MTRILLIVVLASGCAHLSAAKRSCFKSCSQRNDSCVVDAMNAETLQACDQENRQCTESCQDL